MEIRTKVVVFYEERIRSAKEIGELYSISERTVRRWAQHHCEDPETGLKTKKTGPKRSRRAIPASLEQRIIRLRGKYPTWGARRIKHQFNLPCSWRTVHRILKKHGLLIPINAKPQPAGKRYQRQHIDSMIDRVWIVFLYVIGRYFFIFILQKRNNEKFFDLYFNSYCDLWRMYAEKYYNRRLPE